MIGVSTTIRLSEARDRMQVGGKAINLCRLMEAGLPVPPGFVVTTAAFTQAQAQAGAVPEAGVGVEAGGPGRVPADVAESIRAAYEAIGSPAVAVRSSATAEDLAEASLAGQYDTFLDVRGADAVIAAVGKCWQSLGNDRVGAYLDDRGIDRSKVAVAVVVQQMVPAEVSGVLFTANPHTGDEDGFLIEAVYGLGEGIVSGQVQPDVYRVEADTGAVVDLRVAQKKQLLRPGGSGGYEPVDPERSNKACLSYAMVQKLHAAGLTIKRFFSTAQDVEWAIVGGELFILQARPITTLQDARAFWGLIEETRAFAKQEVAQGRGPWVRHNLGETLPTPSPLTWSLIQGFMSGAGGFGKTHERVGFAPSDAAQADGFLTLMAGEIYMDCARLPEMFSAGYPFKYDIDRLRTDPDAAQQPPTVPSGGYAALSAAAKLGRTVTENLRQIALTLDHEFDLEFLPRLKKWAQAQAGDRSTLSDDALAERWRAQCAAVFDDFGAVVFLPSMVEAMAAADLKAFLFEHVWDQDPEALVRALSVGRSADATLQSNIDLQRLARGELALSDWIDAHGDRGPGEFDLMNPRWSEQPEALHAFGQPLADAPDVAARHRERRQQADACLKQLTESLGARAARQLEQRVDLLQRYARFREDGKAALIRALAPLRETALAIGARLNLGDDVFFLESGEMLQALTTGFVPVDRIQARRHRHRAARRVRLPHVIQEADIPTLGEPEPLDAGTGGDHADNPGGNADRLNAFPLASGGGQGPVRIVKDPTQAGDLDAGYVLVCASTDPAWTPLFVNAAGLILERGGSLSHGAIVARELGLPAVVLQDATRLLQDGESVVVDGNHGRVLRSRASEAINDDPTTIDHAMLPPPPNAKENRANQRGLLAAIAWGLVVGLMYLLPPAWMKEPVFALIDAVLWPIVASIGMIGAVGVVGLFFAAVPLLLQKALTDNARLREAKRRAGRLRQAAAPLPEASERKKAMLAAAAPVTMRTLKASMSSLAWVLGPMILIFLWMPERVDPASWNASAAAGSAVTITATIDGDYLGPVVCETANGLAIQPITPPRQTLPPLRATLESLRRQWQRPPEEAALPWQVIAAGEQAQQILLGSLNQFLARPIPPQTLSWVLAKTDDAPGHFPVRLVLEDGASAALTLAFGDQRPPTDASVEPAAGSVLKMEATYARPLQQRHFWQPLKAIGGPSWDAGWLGVYVLVYLLGMLGFKALLKIA